MQPEGHGQKYTVLCKAVTHACGHTNTSFGGSTAQHSTAQHSTAQHSPAQPSPAQHSPAQPSPAQPSPAQPTKDVLVWPQACVAGLVIDRQGAFNSTFQLIALEHLRDGHKYD